MTETPLRSITNRGNWMLILVPTYSTKIFIGRTVMSACVIPFVIGMLLARDSIVDIFIPSSISLPASLLTHSVIHHLMTNSLVVCLKAYDVYYQEGWYIHFASCFLTIIYNVFIHNNAFWSNSNAFSLIICKVQTKRENSSSWKSGHEKATLGHLFCTTPNELKLHGDFLWII